MNINFLSSVLFVKDINVSRQFYESLLKQEIEMNLGLNINFKGRFALWQMDHALQIIHGKPYVDTGANQGEQFELYFESDTIDETYETIKKSGTEFVHEILEQPWGQKVFRIYDPDRYVVEIGEPMDIAILRLFKSGKSISEVAGQTAMPEEIIKAIHDSL